MGSKIFPNNLIHLTNSSSRVRTFAIFQSALFSISIKFSLCKVEEHPIPIKITRNVMSSDRLQFAGSLPQSLSEHPSLTSELQQHNENCGAVRHLLLLNEAHLNTKLVALDTDDDVSF
jgi:hypothetical protein